MEHWKGEKPICALTGSVISGFGLGKHVGTPTANLRPGPGTTLPEPGVYTSKAVLEGCAHPAVTYIGPRPACAPGQRVRVETHLLNVTQDLYGRELTLLLYRRLRPARRFDTLGELLAQIQRDCLAARAFWGLTAEAPRLAMDGEKRRITVDGREVRLSVKEFDLLFLLYSAPDTAFSKGELYERVWREPANQHLHPVENTVFQIRRRLRPYGAERGFIRTLVGYGYQFQPE